jgi:hypothetical protein
MIAGDKINDKRVWDSLRIVGFRPSSQGSEPIVSLYEMPVILSCSLSLY